MKYFTIFFITLLALGTHGFADRMCGPRLSQIMWVVCENGFNDMITKRSGFPNNIVPGIDSELPYPYSAGTGGLADIFQLERENLLAKTRRTRLAGIADECCKKSCTLAELSAYCNP